MKNRDTRPQPMSREEKLQQLLGRGISRVTEKIHDPARAYAAVFIALACIWGLFDPRLWYFANIVLLVLFMAARKRSRFQVPWMLETFAIMGVVCYILTTYYKRADVFSPYQKINTELLSTIWLATASSFGFIFSCLWMIHRQIPTGQLVTTALPEVPIPRKWVIRMYVLGLLMNMARPFVPGAFRVLVISIGHLEIVALLIFLFQSLADAPGFRRSQARWGLIGIAFWFLREVATTLFGGPVATLLGVAPLFARYVKPWVVTCAIAFGLIFVPLIQGVKKQVRASAVEESYYKKEAESIPKVFARNVDKIIIKGDWNAYLKGFDEFVDRIFMTGMLYQIKSTVDQTRNFAGGETLENSIFWNLIPRFVYPGKPITGGSSELARKYGGLQIEEGTSVGIGPISEFYINFGTAGAVIGMIVMGGLYGIVIGKLFRHPLQPLGYIYAAVTFIAVIRPETNLADSFGGALRAVFIWYVVQWYLSRRVRLEQHVVSHVRMPPPDSPLPG